MKTRMLLIACAVALASTQAAAQQTPPKDAKKPAAPAKAAAKVKPAKVPGGICTGAECDVDVMVSACKVSVEYEMLKVKAKKAKIRWSITDANSTFAPTNGIEFKSGGGTVFTDCKPQNGNKEWHCVDENPQPGIYKYNVNVVQSGKACPTLDPDVINEP